MVGSEDHSQASVLTAKPVRLLVSRPFQCLCVGITAASTTPARLRPCVRCGESGRLPEPGRRSGLCDVGDAVADEVQEWYRLDRSFDAKAHLLGW